MIFLRNIDENWKKVLKKSFYNPFAIHNIYRFQAKMDQSQSAFFSEWRK